jgi:hypothetical protein
MNHKLFLSLTFFIISFSLFSGNYDSLYVKKFKQKFTVRFGISTKNLSFTLSPLKKADTLNASPIIYRPNIYSYFNIGGSWKFLGGSISFKIPKPAEDVRIHGKTNYADFRFGLMKKRFASSVYIKQYQGFYIDKPVTVFPEWQVGQPYPQRSDIVYTSFGIEGYYVFKWKKYSLNAAFRQSEKQLKGAGSFMLKGDYSYIGIESDSTLIPYTQAQYYNEMRGLRSSGFISGVISGGYTYVFILGKNWFFSPFLFTGFGYQAKGFMIDDTFIKNKTLFAFTDFKLNGGFNGNRFFSTFVFDAENYFMNEKEISLQTTGAIFDINIGF